MDRIHQKNRENRVQRREVLVGAGPEVDAALRGIPPLVGLPIRFEWGGQLRAWRGALTQDPRRGTEVHAATFLRQRRMILDGELRRIPNELRRILVHELAHFAWLRLGNPQRKTWESVVREERRRGARGELGWSAEWRKQALFSDAGRAFRDYLCESFCDSVAYFYHRPESRPHPEHTLANRFRLGRIHCLSNLLWEEIRI